VSDLLGRSGCGVPPDVTDVPTNRRQLVVALLIVEPRAGTEVEPLAVGLYAETQRDTGEVDPGDEVAVPVPYFVLTCPRGQTGQQEAPLDESFEPDVGRAATAFRQQLPDHTGAGLTWTVQSVGCGREPAKAVPAPFEVIEHTNADSSATLRRDITDCARQARAGNGVDIDDIGARDGPGVLDQSVDTADASPGRADDLWRWRSVEPVQAVQPGGRLEGGDESSTAAWVASHSSWRAVGGVDENTRSPGIGSRIKPTLVAPSMPPARGSTASESRRTSSDAVLPLAASSGRWGGHGGR
jgi:hypothetical protein